MTSQHEVHVMN